ncbi:MAG: hypothetical protein K8S20_05435 [Chloroflexi bacterium]|nr:hypothetical protein [Chloroflexota bacterium]
MNIKPFLILCAVFLLAACSGAPETAAPVPVEAPAGTQAGAPDIVPIVTPVCISSQPAQDDIDRALSFTGDLFSAPEWVRTYTVADGRVSVVWSNDPLGVVAYSEALIFPCGYEEPDLNVFFSDASWQIIFANYDSFETTSACKIDAGLRLYEFKAATGGFDYNIRYWAQNDTDNRVIGTMIVFPVESLALMDDYSTRLFPDLITCPK